jgi:hypothetical protein
MIAYRESHKSGKDFYDWLQREGPGWSESPSVIFSNSFSLNYNHHAKAMHFGIPYPESHHNDHCPTVLI